MEQNYDFRKRLNTVHKHNRVNASLCANENETAVDNCWQIVTASDAAGYLLNVAKDLQDYLFTSMNVSVLLTKNPHNSNPCCKPAGVIHLTTKASSPALGKDLTVARGYRIIVQPNEITVIGFDERGTGQGCYYIEDMMNLREAPFLPIMDEIRNPVFSPRMIHSGWIMDQFPDPHLDAIAHAGLDAVLLFVSGINATPTAYVDINDLIERAAKYGLDVYLYSYLVSELHPDDPKAPEFYENLYGNLIKAHPKAKGIIFVGESCEFPSKDPHTTGRLRMEPSPDGLPDTRPSPGWWPCTDYPDWLNMLKKIMWKYNPDLDIVFWTYNWGWAPEEDRLALIRSLPTDVSLQATFEMFEDIEKDGIMTRCADYTASFEGPGVYFKTEAETAHERGLRLYTMCNTGGLTWDIGVIPYQPIPFQWDRRHKALLKAHEEWGLKGLMESHHFGFWPSFVSELAKWAYWTPAVSVDEISERIAARDFSADAAPLVIKAWHAWSDAWRDYVVTNEDQYGAFRVGPSYPFFLLSDPEPLPSASYAHFGSCICMTDYVPHEPKDVEVEYKILERMASRWQEGITLLTQAIELTPDNKKCETLRMLNLGRFILNCVNTTINTKKWWIIKQELKNETEQNRINSILDRMMVLINNEIANAKATIPLVEEDSRLGWEPSMEYMTDRSHLEWKIALLKKIVDIEIPQLRKT